jgi:hypothetical protein
VIAGGTTGSRAKGFMIMRTRRTEGAIPQSRIRATDFLLMENVWLILAEVIGDLEASSESKIGFINIAKWADSKEAASSKIEKCLNSFGWRLVLVDKAELIGEESRYGGEVIDMIDRMRNNPEAIILGTFHTYKTN